MFMIDNQTKSLWQQATGECIYGKSKGKRLEFLSGENTSWNAWMSKYPNSESTYKCIEARKGYLTRAGMIKNLNFITPKITSPGFTDLKGLPTRETVFGIECNGISKAYALSELQNLNTFYDYFNNTILKLEFDKSIQYITAVDSDTEK